MFLGIIERLPRRVRRWRDELIVRHSEAIERTIVDAAKVGVQQALAAFSALGGTFRPSIPRSSGKIFDQLPEPEIASLQTDNERFYWAELLSEAARLPNADARPLRERALQFYEAARVKPQPFHLQRRAELLLDMGRPDQAEPLLRDRPDVDRSEWIQRLMARARLDQGFPAEAFEWIDRALAKLNTDHFRSEFLELRFEIRHALGDRLAIDDLEGAVQACRKEKEGARLRAKLAEWGSPRQTPSV